ADLGNHLRRVAGEVALQDLEHAAGMLEGRVTRERAVGFGYQLRPRNVARPGSAVDRVAVHTLVVLRRDLRSVGPAVCGAVTGYALITPMTGHRIVDAGFRVKAAEQTVQILGILEALLDQSRRIGEMKNVLLEPAIVGQDVVDHAAQKRDVAAGAD